MKTRFGSEKQKKQEKKNSSVNLTKKPLLKQSKLDFSCTSQDAEQSIMIKESRRNISNNSFKEDGMCVPSYEDISSEKKICNNNTDIETRYGSRKNKERKKHYKELSYVNVSKTPKLRQCKLDFSCTSQDVEQSIKNKESQRNISNNSFKRDGRCVPSYEDISRQKKIYDNNTDVETRYGSRNKKQKKLYKNLSSMNTKKKPVPKKCKLNFGCTSQDAEQPIKNKEKQRNISDVKPYNSFKKYGMYVPSYEDILNEKKNCDIFNEIVMDMMESISPLPVIKKISLENTNNIVVQDCKKISLENLKIIFEKNIEYLDEIKMGKIESKRHELFKKDILSDDLTYNTSMILFTNEQKQTLVNLLCKKYDDSPLSIDYYFKVLLPELCLKIYIDEYGINKKEAIKYLDNYPIVEI